MPCEGRPVEDVEGMAVSKVAGLTSLVTACRVCPPSCLASCRASCPASCLASCPASCLKSRLPVLSWLPGYTSSQALSDLIAGLTVGLTVIPQGDVMYLGDLQHQLTLSRYRLCLAGWSASPVWTVLRLHGQLCIHHLRQLQGEVTILVRPL